MSEPDPAEPEFEGADTAGGRRVWARALGILALGVLGAGLVAWSERRTIGTAVIDRTLAAAHVRARYRIVDLGLGRQRLADVRIGDPARPDLVADWIELQTRVGLDGATLTSVSAGGLRVRAAVVDGRLSLGEIDRLLPESSNGTFRLPALDLHVSEARASVTSRFGIFRLSLTGGGRLDGGFRGRMAAASDRVTVGRCLALRAALAGMIGTDGGAVTLRGPIGAERIGCAGGSVERPTADVAVTLLDGLGAWRGHVAMRGDRVAIAGVAARTVGGRVTFRGSKASTMGDLRLFTGSVRAAAFAGRSISVSGRYRLGADSAFAGTIGAAGAVAPERLLVTLGRVERSGAGTPVGPLVSRVSAALTSAGKDLDVAAEVAADQRGIAVSRLDAAARSGARAAFVADAPVRIEGGASPAFSGTARVSGGGLPVTTLRLSRSDRDGVVQGVAEIAPYAAGGARLELTPLRFTSGGVSGQVTTVATVSGPLGDGRIDGLRVPIAATWDGAGVGLGSGCITVALERLVVSTLRLNAARVPICAIGRALVRINDGRVSGETQIRDLRFEGTLGRTPLTLTADETRVDLAHRRVETARVAARLGAGEATTRLEATRLSGAVTPGGLAGRFEGGAGQIGKVPLLLSDGAGGWRFAGRGLTLGADATVTDAGTPARFKPLRAGAIDLRLVDGTIVATTTIAASAAAVRIADVAIRHDLGRGVGDATLAVPGLAFTKGFQPDALTPLTFGVIADVRGTVRGNARIGWTPDGATGTGTFRTDGLDLAAAFGPVRALAGTIRFTDLLRLASAPGQVVTVASIDPGVPVEDGRIVYRLLPEARVEIASGSWPFAGGSLELRPTTLSFGAPSERRLTFVLDAIDAGKFLQQFDFENLSATGTFDGTLPMVFDARGGRIEGGELRVRPGGGNLAYLGELTRKDLGTWGNIAFQALRSIDYRDLRIEMNGPLAGEMITDVRFAGISQGKGARSNFLVRRLQQLPFLFNIRIEAPFRGLIDSAQSFYDPSRLVSRNLPALLREQAEASAPAIQAGASEPRP